jgi:hypothetical protein
MPVAVIDEAKSLTGAPLLFDLNRLSVASTLVTGKVTLLLGQRTSMPSSRWLKEKAAMQW